MNTEKHETDRWGMPITLSGHIAYFAEAFMDSNGFHKVFYVVTVVLGLVVAITGDWS